MSLGVACLLANYRVTALSIADRLDALKKERRVIESQRQKEAFTIIGGSRGGLCTYPAHVGENILGRGEQF